ncbi:uncharacterized protein Dana_GF13068 [Drosophila ananassae]|uniref:Aquaporin n=1 Tax=Drosophila ananassae TaxID=7217 RepID=B3MFH8_DROAN|nr:aquaporin-2 [Drosophila ananassae]EDV36663.1 uncharacterized protein Dana_GF13068 [Drosophila ananassae]
MIWDWFTFVRVLSEFCATTLLMLLGCMGDAVNKANGGSFWNSIHYGLAVMIIMHVFGFVSGAHANPCITLSCYFMGYIATDTMFLYLACQMVGGFFGYSMLLLMLPKEILDNNKPAVCLIEPMSSLSSIQIVAIEGVLTAILLLGWCALWDVRNGRFLDSVSIRMGFLVTACGFAGAQLTGAILNPTKTLIPAIFEGHPDKILMQVTGQVLAAISVPFLWHYGFTPRYKPLDEPNPRCRINY